jgi:hypothetical protein
MSRYLVVAHQTALSPDLQRKVRALIAEDSAAEFAVLVPETPGVPLTWEGETVDVAAQRAEASKTLLEETAGARVFRTAVGAPGGEGNDDPRVAGRRREEVRGRNVAPGKPTERSLRETVRERDAIMHNASVGMVFTRPPDHPLQPQVR